MIEYTKEKLSKIVSESYTYKQVLDKFERNDSSNSYRVLKNLLSKWKIDNSHFLNRSQCTTKLYEKGVFKKLDETEIFKINSSVSRNSLRKRIIDNKLIPYSCNECGQTEMWRGKKITLILDHINGIRNDNRLENLRFMCPNCNATLDTHCLGHKGLMSNEEKESIKLEKKRLKNKHGSRNDYNIVVKKENHENIHKKRIKTVENSDIDFSKLGWVTKISKEFGISPQKVNSWFKKHMLEFYETKCYKRNK